MHHISLTETSDLVGKLLEEKIPVQAVLFSPRGTRISFFGFVDSKTQDNGIVVSASGPPIDVTRGYFNFSPFDRECEFSYGEKRELAADLQSAIPANRGESCLLFDFPDSGERFGLFFTL